MRLREMWILGLGLAWWCAPAYATPFRDVPGGSEEHQGASSLHSKANRPSKGGWRSEGSWQAPVGSLPPGLEKKGDFLPPGLEKKGDFLPPGLEKEGDFLPPGLEKEGDFLPPGLEKKGDFLPPGLVVVNDDFLSPEDQPAGAGLIPEPTGLILFGGGLLLAVASERRRRSS